MRYEIRPIRDPEMTRLGAVIATAESRSEAEAIASAESLRQYGVAIIDTVEQTIDFGDRVIAIQEWLFESADAPFAHLLEEPATGNRDCPDCGGTGLLSTEATV